jgi:ADP-heptose:LPS heptosyltransferase
MGDVAMIVPTVRALSQQHPNIKITVVSIPFFEPFFQNIPNVRFFAFQNKEKGTLQVLKLFWELKSLKPTCFIDFHNVLRTKILIKLFNLFLIKTAIISKDRKAKKELIREENKIFRPIKTIFEKQLKLLDSIGFPIDLSKIIFPEKQILLPNIIETLNIDTKKELIGIAPFAQHLSKVYPLDLMQKVINELSKNQNYQIILFGGGTLEIEQLNKLSETKANVIVAAGKINFKQEIDLISNLKLMLSMDSGNAHIAAMQGVNVLTLWGATHPYAGFSAFNQPKTNHITSNREIYPKIPTSIYGNKKVEGYEEVMRTIEPEIVVEKIESLLKQKEV